MGAEYCQTVIADPMLEMTDTQIREAAQGIIKQAEYDYGHSGYSGSFAEKESVTIHRGKIFESEESADKFIDDMDNSKWGPADVVPVKGVGWYMAGWCSS